MVDWEKHPEQQSGEQPPLEQAPPAGWQGQSPPPAPQPGHPSPGQPPPGYPPHGYPPQGYGPYGYAPPPYAKPSTNIGWAIGALIAFWPLAIPSFIAALKVDDLWLRGDAAGARRASDDARRFGVIGVVIGAAFAVLAFLFVIVFFVIFAGAVHDLN